MTSEDSINVRKIHIKKINWSQEIWVLEWFTAGAFLGFSYATQNVWYLIGMFIAIMLGGFLHGFIEEYLRIKRQRKIMDNYITELEKID